jgi:hypothetical protein
MSSITLKAHYDGKHIVLDEPFELPANAPLAVTLLPLDDNAERKQWATLGAPNLAKAYGKDEPEYTPPSFFASCLAAAKTAADVPPDLLENVDAYLYGGKTLLPS